MNLTIQIKIINIGLNKIINTQTNRMTSLLTANNVINLIIRQSKQKIHQNKIVKNTLTPYSASSMLNTKTDLILQSGANNQISNLKNLKNQLNSQIKPVSIEKDAYSFFAVKKYKQQKKENSEASIVKDQNPKKSVHKFYNRKGTKNSAMKNQLHLKGKINDSLRKKISQQAIEVSQSLKDVSSQQKKVLFLKIDEKRQMIPRFLLYEQTDITLFRQRKQAEYNQRETQRHRQGKQSQLNTQRQKKLKSYLQNHISKQNNSHTYDIEGNLMLFSHQNTKNAIKKQYPPTIRYQVQNQEQDLLKSRKGNARTGKNNKSNSLSDMNRKEMYFNNHNMRGAKGQIFKSSVLKTINLSRISLGGNQQDEIHFMKRNDLFNNNHCRQTTSIPFIKVEGGAMFKQTATNQCISNKDVQTEADSKVEDITYKQTYNQRPKSHQCRSRSQFKKFSLGKEAQTCSNFYEKGSLNRNSASNQIISKDHKMYPVSVKNSKNYSKIGDSRYSTFYFKRPHTTEVGRINRQNSSLFHSMLEV